jgi:hypothetical protein
MSNTAIEPNKLFLMEETFSMQIKLNILTEKGNRLLKFGLGFYSYRNDFAGLATAALIV